MRRPASVVLALLLPPLVAGAFVAGRRSVDGRNLFEQVLDRVSATAVDSLPIDSIYVNAARGLVRSLNDPYAEVYSPKDLSSFNRTTLGASYGGLGMQIQDQEGMMLVTQVFPGSPADAGGVQAGDRILQVDTTPTVGLKVDQVSSRLTGKAGTQVEVMFGRAGVGEPIKMRLTRAMVHYPAVPFAIMLDGNIGYVPLQRFSEHSTEEVTAAMTRLRVRGAKSYILDMRGNLGGSLDQSLEMSNLFLPLGAEIATVRSRQAPVTYHARRQPLFPAEPLIILVDGYSASATEIVSGSVQDHDRALIVGTTSFGKGLVQSLYGLEGGWGVKLTTGKWYTPSGRSIQKERKLLPNGELVEVMPDSLETDSARHNRPVFRSDAGRAVYGGGGITPDLIIASDTMSTVEQTVMKAMAPKSQQAYIALYKLALDARPGLKNDFTVRPAWRERFYQKLKDAGVAVTRAQYDSATPLIDRLLEQRIANVAFGDSTVFRHLSKYDSQFMRAAELLRVSPTQQTLFEMAERQTRAVSAKKAGA